MAEWKTVDVDGFPPCDGHTTFIGINSAGYPCCFNAMRGGLCVMETAEGAYPQMSDLRDWRLLDRPARGVSKSCLPAWCCQKGKALNVEVCPDCADAHSALGGEVAEVARDIARWFVNGDRPDEFKLKEWAERLDRDSIGRAYEDRSAGVGGPEHG